MSSISTAISAPRRMPDLRALRPSAEPNVGILGKPSLSASELLLDFLPDALELVLGIRAAPRNQS
jgi:hypothetical protein